MTAASLRAAIEAAWENAQYPGDRFVSAGYDNEEVVRKELVGKHWRDVSPAFAKPFAYGENLKLLKPAALALFLPAFMLLDIEDNSMWLVETLAPVPKKWRNADNTDAFWARIDALTEDQKRVIARLFAYWRSKGLLLDDEWDVVLEYYEPCLDAT